MSKDYFSNLSKSFSGVNRLFVFDYLNWNNVVNRYTARK